MVVVEGVVETVEIVVESIVETVVVVVEDIVGVVVVKDVSHSSIPLNIMLVATGAGRFEKWV